MDSNAAGDALVLLASLSLLWISLQAAGFRNTPHATVNGAAAAVDPDGRIVVKELPARIEVVAGSHEGQ